MGHYEPPPNHGRKAPGVAKPLRRTSRKVSGNSIVKGLAGLVTTLSAAAAFSLVDMDAVRAMQERIQTRDAIIQQYAPQEIHPPMVEATTTAQGTMPIADGVYVQLAAVSPATLPNMDSYLQKAEIPATKEPLPNGLTRILIHEEAEGLHRKVTAFKQAYPETKPLVLVKENGKDSFRKYEHRQMHASLEEYCRAAGGDIRNMPFYDSFKRSAQRQMAERNVGQFGFTEHTFLVRLMAMTYAESSFDPEAESKVGARGLMQLMPGTVEWKGGDMDRIEDPDHNIALGSDTYTSFLYFAKNEMKQESASTQRRTSLRAYNLGPGNVKKGRTTKETEDYLKKIARNEEIILSYFPR